MVTTATIYDVENKYYLNGDSFYNWQDDSSYLLYTFNFNIEILLLTVFTIIRPMSEMKSLVHEISHILHEGLWKSAGFNQKHDRLVILTGCDMQWTFSSDEYHSEMSHFQKHNENLIQWNPSWM